MLLWVFSGYIIPILLTLTISTAMLEVMEATLFYQMVLMWMCPGDERTIFLLICLSYDVMMQSVVVGRIELQPLQVFLLSR